MTTPKLMTVREVAGRLGVSADTVYQWSYQNKLPKVKLGRRVRFDSEVVERIARDGFNIVNTILTLRLRHHGTAIALNPQQRAEFVRDLAATGGAEIDGPLPRVPSKHSGPVIMLDGVLRDVVNAEVLGIFNGTMIVAASATEAA